MDLIISLHVLICVCVCAYLCMFRYVAKACNACLKDIWVNVSIEAVKKKKNRVCITSLEQP